MFLTFKLLDKLLGIYCIFNAIAKNIALLNLVPKTRFTNQSLILDILTSL